MFNPPLEFITSHKRFLSGEYQVEFRIRYLIFRWDLWRTSGAIGADSDMDYRRVQELKFPLDYDTTFPHMAGSISIRNDALSWEWREAE